jgi:imidazolonepropionase-like amidohydrolase
MPTLTRLALLLAASAWPLAGQRTPLAAGVIVIRNVNVVPMTRDTVLRSRSVTIRDGRIAAIQPASAAAPSGARVIDAAGKYLVPGFADVHTHLYSDEEVADSLAPYELGVMLAHGITTARLMIGTPEQLTLRADVESGRVLGPQLWLAGPQLTGSRSTNAHVVTTPDEARAAVQRMKRDGFDFIKLTENLPPPVYDAIMDEARRQRIPVDGHVDTRVGVAHALAAGQNIQHLDSYLEAVLADTAPSRESLTQGGVGRLQNWKSMDYVDARKIAVIAGATARAGIWSTPTLTIFNKAFGIGFTDDELHSSPDWNLMPAGYRSLYLRARTRYWNPANDSVRTPERRRKYVATRSAIAKAISDSGGRILVGSDSPDLLMIYGLTFHRELEALVQAGLSPYQALRAGTRNAAEYFGALGEWGTVEVGRRADLVLLNDDPLANIGNTKGIVAVAIGGRWLDRQQLDEMVYAAQQRINGGDTRALAASPACGSPARSAHASAYDPIRGRVVAFGGETAQGPSNALWAWDGANWDCLRADGPAPRTDAMLAFDQRRRVLVLYGGRSPTGDVSRETWELRESGWVLANREGPTREPHGGLAFDAASGGILLLAPAGDASGTGATWKWDGATWTRAASMPSPGYPNAMISSTATRPALLVMAQPTEVRGAFKPALYEWESGAWQPVIAGGVAPTFSPQAPVAVTRDGLVLFAGFEQDRSVSSWSLVDKVWRRIDGPMPSRRRGAAMTFDPRRGIAVLHGGDDGDVVLGDTWEWNGSVWRRVQ